MKRSFIEKIAEALNGQRWGDYMSFRRVLLKALQTHKREKPPDFTVRDLVEHLVKRGWYFYKPGVYGIQM